MKNKPLSLGFIGGAIDSAVGYAHYSSLKMDNKWSLDAGCFSRNEEKNIKSAETYGVDENRIYTCWKKMLEEEKGRIDAVAILTPTPSHFEIVHHCLETGIPVISEKALAMNSNESKQIEETCKKTKGFLAVTYNYSGYPMIRELKNLIKKNKLGKILHFQAEMPQEGFIRVDENGNKPNPQTWRLSDNKIPTIHLDLAVHLHQMIYYLTEEQPTEVISDQASDGWFKNIIDNVECLCRYSNNIKGKIWFSKSALGHRNGMKISIYGSEASAIWEQCNPEELTLSFADGHKQILDRASNVSVTNKQRYNRFKSGHPAGFIEAFANLYSDIADCLEEYKLKGTYHSKEVFDAKLATQGLEFLEAMVLSSQSKKWENVEQKVITGIL